MLCEATQQRSHLTDRGLGGHADTPTQVGPSLMIGPTNTPLWPDRPGSKSTSRKIGPVGGNHLATLYVYLSEGPT